MIDIETGFTKRAMKGIKQDSPVYHQDFLDALYDNQNLTSDQRRMQRHKKSGLMGVVSIKKNALNNIYTKLNVESDRITCTPLKLNGNYI